MQRFFTALFVICFLALGCAKSYQANGYVFSIVDKQPIDSAEVKVYLGDSTQVYDVIYTDTTGYFEIAIGDLGCTSCPDFWFLISAPGHKAQKFTKMEGETIYLPI